MPDTRECPLCGGTMQKKVQTTVTPIPGQREASTKENVEWVCPDCDYFEEADGENT